MLPPAFRSSGDLLADRRYDYAMAAKADGDLNAAADLLVQALEIAPGWAAGWFALGEVEAGRGAAEAAAQAYRRALAIDPADTLGARLMLARLGMGDPAQAMSSAYVTALYEDYAPRFEEALRRRLSYRGPEMLLDAVTRACAASGRPLRFATMLDLGCGTGLAGEVFASVAGAIDGVDLSARMADQARRRSAYRSVQVGDLGAFLAARDGATADLVVAADVFIYCADIGPILAEARRVLTPGGFCAFTVETHGGNGVALGAALRYAHGEDAVRAALATGGLEPLVFEPAAIREEAGRPVPGVAVVAAKG
ncbi:class I SAM-dependent DNA methyltransferase [Phreatobacter cathodiphilus]|uniref:SAM-dependent methyltransferase n=1 Tax=Phreatobacter cathodiphilus TaxID=1868589 RepID=A0A2S0NDL6_9HYPH|nr:methyltransferase domain-containing protein [Phreatobacter cathodiphilus]AVO46245.1 SAM-dependent methyltransferase [Phreatobacter cathodiphilus]